MVYSRMLMCRLSYSIPTGLNGPLTLSSFKTPSAESVEYVNPLSLTGYTVECSCVDCLTLYLKVWIDHYLPSQHHQQHLWSM